MTARSGRRSGQSDGQRASMLLPRGALQLAVAFALAPGASGVTATASTRLDASSREQTRWTMKDLGTLRGDESSEAVAINGRGEIIGNSYTHGAPHPSRAFLWRDG